MRTILHNNKEYTLVSEEVFEPFGDMTLEFMSTDNSNRLEVNVFYNPVTDEVKVRHSEVSRVFEMAC